MSIRCLRTVARSAITTWLLSVSLFAADATPSKEQEDTPSKETSSKTWDIESPPGKASSQPIDVTEGTWMNLDVSPDGKTIVFDLLGDIYSMPVEGEEPREPKKLTSGICWDMQPRFSPDGQWIAFTSDRTGKNERAGDNIWIMRADGSDARQVTNETFRLLNGPAWSPDGDYIIARKHFTSRRSLGSGEIWMYHRAAKSASAMSGVQLTTKPNEQKDVNEPIYSPDGKYVYYSQDTTPGSNFEYDKDSHGQIYTIKRLNLEDGDTEAFVTGPGGACRPTPSHDGKSLAFVRRVGAKTALHVLDLQSGAVRMVYDELERDMQEAWAIHGVYPCFAWMPDDQSIIAWAKGQIRRIDIQSGEATVIPFHIVDEREIRDAVRFAVDVAPDTFPVKMLRWVNQSPDGKHVAYQALGKIWLKELPDGEPRRLTEQEDHLEFYPSFSRDGKYIVYSTWHDKDLGSIRVTALDSSNAENWTVTDAPGHYLQPVFSPDGQTIVFIKSGDGYLRSPLWSREPGLYQIAARDGEPKLITQSGETPQFGSESDRVYYLKTNRNSDADNLMLCSIGLDGKDAREHLKSTWGTTVQVSPDGKWAAFIERFNVYVSPLVKAGKAINIGPKGSSLPIAKVSQQAGDWCHFSGDSSKLLWTLGPTLYSKPLDEAFAFLKGETEDVDSEEATEKPDDSESDEDASSEDADDKTDDSIEELAIGFDAKTAIPETAYALVGGKIVTMGKQGVINPGTIIVRGNRIEALGAKSDIDIPDDVKVIPTPGMVILPGLIDVHAHGPMSSDGITPQQNWVNYARLAFGITTAHDPSNDTGGTFSAIEMIRAGKTLGPRTFSTGTILYGAAGSFKAEIENLDDAKFHLQRMKAVGAFSVKSYNQPRRDQRQQVLAAARELEMMVVPEGGSTFMHNMTMIVDGHTGIEHTLPVQSAYDDVFDLWRGTNVGYTPTLCVAYGGISGERYWYEVDDVWRHPRLKQFLPPHKLHPQSHRRQKAPLEDYNHIRVAEIAKQVVDDDGLVQAGGHGQLNGIDTHWELWSFVQGGMTPMQSLACGTIKGAKYLGLDGDIGSLETGKLADLIVIERGFDPTEEIRHSDKIDLVMINGRLFRASSMEEVGGAEQPAPEFFFSNGQTMTAPIMSRLRGCECCRPGGLPDWMLQSK
ncbi:amidohydrolase family protein [Stieleria sp. JC731]|uniref:amidohydrolase family protein n=1 Tax=Pirellulaceae TaxID=2691357 RepID=UPI001E3307AA|nr:amidohydrolase family protein [Stieleria sp. JC731]MCC9599111.1 amidohydrolase family protein [Stieleria sp. JC731]